MNILIIQMRRFSFQLLKVSHRLKTLKTTILQQILIRRQMKRNIRRKILVATVFTTPGVAICQQHIMKWTGRVVEMVIMVMILSGETYHWDGVAVVIYCHEWTSSCRHMNHIQTRGDKTVPWEMASRLGIIINTFLRWK